VWKADFFFLTPKHVAVQHETTHLQHLSSALALLLGTVTTAEALSMFSFRTCLLLIVAALSSVQAADSPPPRAEANLTTHTPQHVSSPGALRAVPAGSAPPL
jgi:hypothetical protein